MREWLVGFETGNITAESLTLVAGGAFLFSTTTIHTDRAGAGGLRAGRCSTSGDGTYRNTYPLAHTAREWYGRIFMYFELAEALGTAPYFFGFRFRSTTGNEFGFRYDPPNTFTLFRGTSTTVATVAFSGLKYNQYQQLEWRYVADGANGRFDLFIDPLADYSNPILSFVGNTVAASAAINNFEIFGRQGFFDDLAINSVTLGITASAGAFNVGDTVTGGTSGATVLITSANPTTLWCWSWNGTPFVDGETVTSTSGGTATVVAPSGAYANGFTPNSSYARNGFQVRRPPTAAGNTSQLQNSASAPATNNWQYVDEVPPNTTDWTTSSTPNQYDTYAVGPLPASAVSVKALRVYNYALTTNAGVIGNYNNVLRTGGTDYFGPDIPLTAAYACLQRDIWNVSPATNEPFTVAAVNSSQPGFRVRT
jgi:hypothetical protein